MFFNNKTLASVSIFLFFVPVIAFLNRVNLPQILLLDLYLILISQILLLITIFFFSFILQKFLLRNFITLKSFFLVNSLTTYLLFFYKNLKSLFFDKQNFLFDDILVLIIYFIIYLFLIYFVKKYLEFLLRFLIIYVFLQLGIFSINFYNSQINLEKPDIKNNNFNFLFGLDTNLLEENSKSSAIFFIILDGMMSLSSAEKLEIINNKKKLIDSLEENNLIYKEGFFTNYDATYLSLTSLLEGSYPILDSSKKYHNRKKFFPAFILNQRKDNNFFQILRKTNKKFYWLGNSWAFCQDNIYIRCVNSNSIYKYFSKIKLFYLDSIFIYFFNFYPYEDKSKESLNFLNNTNLKFKNNEIYLIHVLSPRPPHFFDENCKIKNRDQISKISSNKEMEYYKYAYNCLIDVMNTFTSRINEIDKNSMVFILSDHGWKFDEKTMQNYNLDPEDSRFNSFFSYKVPSACSKKESPNSIVNVMRFALICDGNNKIKYLEDLKFKTFYEDNPNYGKVILKN